MRYGGDLVFTNDASGAGEKRDSSLRRSRPAGCGLLELAGWLPAGAKSAAYRAEAMVQSLYEGYSTKDNPASNVQILHGIYCKLAGHGMDEANLWGDYFYIEALMHLARPNWEAYW